MLEKRGFREVVPSHLAGLGGDLLLESLEGGLTSQCVGLLDIFAFLVEDELSGLSWLDALATEIRVIIRIVPRVLLGRASKVGGLRFLGSSVDAITGLGEGGSGEFI